MSKIESRPPGSFCWAELAAGDTESAKRFYTAMFGWAAREIPVPGGVYTIFQSEGNDAAAMYAAQPGVPPHWNVYFSVADLDATTAKIVPAGGKVQAGPFDVMEEGRMTAAQDPQGAAFCLWQPKRSIGATHGGPLNQVSWAELATHDPVGAAAFYTGLLGWTAKPAAGLAEAQYVEWVNAGRSIGGMLPMRGDQWKGVPPHWMIYVTVADCDERTAQAKELGATVCVPPTDIPNAGRFAVITDAQGAVFAVIRLAGVA